MSQISTLFADYGGMARMLVNGRRRADRLAQTRDERLRMIIQHAAATVPYYRRLLAGADLTPGDIKGVADLVRLPVTDKATLQGLPVTDRLSSAFAIDDLRHVRTSGSTGRPFDIWHDPSFSRRRRIAFLRSLLAGGYCWPMRLMLVSGPPGRTAPAAYRWRYVHGEIEPAALRDEVRRWRPDALYGFATPLRQLATLIEREGTTVPRARMIFTTAEGVDKATRELLLRHVGDSVFELYGTTEMGPIAWECRAHDGLHLADDTTIVELINTDSNTGEAQLVATSLDLYGMPLIRYAVGDLAIAGPLAACACGSRFSRLTRVAGRMVDCVTLADGRELSPYHLTEGVEDVRGLLRYQIVQEALDQFRVRAQLAAGSEAADAAIVSGLRPLLGEAAAIAVERVANLDPPPGRKFRVVVNKLRLADSG